MDGYIKFCFEDAVRSTAVSGTRRPAALEDYLLRECLQNMEVSVSDDATTEIQSDGSRPSTASSSDTGDTFDEISHSRCLEFLLRNGHKFLMKNLDCKERICSVLQSMADIVKVLPPPNEPLAWDILSMSRWRDSLRELINEMKTVEELENFPSLIGNCGVYVLTTSPYPAFLRALAAEIADRHS